MSSKPVIVARQLGKTFQLYKSPIDRLKQMLARSNRRYYREFVALHDVSFELGKGEVLGLVGRNGAGKSTLLQLICGTLSPTSGSIAVNGRVAALLELGAGFNPEFTGQENIYLNASILGLDRAEIDERYDAIVEFSGIADFIQQPVKTYSSGMYVRLAFSIATSVDPDILVIDEALSVGDGAFARKSFDRIMQLRDKGATILFCSHSMYQIESLCTSVIWLENGQVKRIGAPGAVTAAYQEALDQLSTSTSGANQVQAARPVATSPGQARIRALDMVCDGEHGISAHAVSRRSDIEITIGFDSDIDIHTPNAAVTINAADGRILASSGTWIDGVTLQRDVTGRGTAIVRFPAIALLKGRYTISAYLFCERGLHVYDSVESFATLTLEQMHLEQGIVSLPHSWRVEAGLAVAGQPTVSDAPSGPPLALPPDWSPRFRTHWSRAEDQQGLLALFSQAFGTTQPAKRWDWKYRQAFVWGTVVRQENQYAAFFGGMPRAMVHAGKTIMTVQIGDVMVAPAHRGALARTGPLFRGGAAYFDNLHQLYPEARFAFGFPSLRHVKLGIKLGLYLEVDSISTLIWSPLPPARNALSKTRELLNLLGHAESTRLQQLWRAMQKDWPDMLLPVRDAERWHYRYAEHPEYKYQVMLVSNRWTGRPLAAVVVRAHADHLEWLDYLGPRSGIEVALRVVRMHAGQLGLPGVRGWFSSRLVQLFAQGQAVVEPTEIRVPVNLRGRTPDTARPPAPMWLMAGDTDFR